MSIWDTYSRIKIIRQNNYITIFKVENLQDKSYAVIKQYDKKQYKKFHSYDFEEKDIIQLPKEYIIDKKNNDDLYFYLIIKYTEVNLKEYLNITETPFNYKDIREILLKLNTNLKFLCENNLSYEFNEENIILPLDTIDHQTVMLIKNRKEELNNKNTHLRKEFLYSIGKIIYLLLFLQPISEYRIFIKDRLDLIENNILKNIIKKMLNKEEIDLETYLTQPFFKEPYIKEKKIEKFDIHCIIHPNKYNFYYCVNCQKNICDICYEEHSSNSHKIIEFYKIKLNKWEKFKMENILKEIDENYQILNKWKESILKYIKNFEINDNNNPEDYSEIYENDLKNNFKQYYLNQLEIIKEKTSINNYLKKEKLKLDNLFNYIDYSQIKEKENSIYCIYNVPSDRKETPKQLITMDDMNELTSITINNTKMSEKSNESILNEGENIVKFNFNRPDDISHMFSNCIELTSINLFNLNTDEVNDMNNMFAHCIELKSVDFSNLNISSVENIFGIFYKCSSLITINFSNVNTSKFEYMYEMFANCTSLKNLDLSNFNTENVKDMSEMFSGCSSLESLDLSNFKTNKLEYINGMFFGCKSLKYLDLSNFNIKNVNSLQQLFSGCSNLRYLDISNFNTNKVTNMKQTFADCSSLRYLNLINFNLNEVSLCEEMFYNCSKLERIDLSHTTTSKIKHVKNMFFNCSSMKYLNLELFNFRLVTNLKGFLGNIRKDCEVITIDQKIKEYWEKIKNK